MSEKLGVVLLAIVVFAGCDPGWRYRMRDIVGTQDQRSYPIPETQGVKGTVECSLFSMGLSVAIDIVNHGSDSLSVDPTLLRVSDIKGNDLSKVWVACNGSNSDNAIVLSAGQSCKLIGRFQVAPTEGCFGRSPNHDLKELTVSVKGLVRGGKSISLQIPLEWDLDR